MKILLLNGSPRKGGNTEIMADGFIKGAAEGGSTVEKVNLRDLKINPCIACEYCASHNGSCVQDDGMVPIYRAMDRADLIVFASPIYYFGMTAQMISVINRFYAMGKVGFRPTDSALLLDSASPDVYTAAVAQYKDLIRYLKWKDRGIITISGMKFKGAMKESDQLDKVKKLGREIGKLKIS